MRLTSMAALCLAIVGCQSLPAGPSPILPLGAGPASTDAPKSGAVTLSRAREDAGPRALGVNATEYAAALKEAALAADSRVPRVCDEPASVGERRARFASAQDAVLQNLSGGSAKLVRESVAVSACGEVRRQALYPHRDGAGALVFFAALPGDTLASPGLQSDAVDQLVAQAVGIHVVGRETAGRMSACEPMKGAPWVTDTRVTSKPRRGVWTETWSLAVCGETRTMSIRFEETATGARFSSDIDLLSDADLAES